MAGSRAMFSQGARYQPLWSVGIRTRRAIKCPRLGIDRRSHTTPRFLVINADASELADIFWRSLQVSGVAVLGSSLVGIPAGVWLGSTRFRGRSLLTVLIQTGMALPPVVVGLVVYLLLSRSGPLGGLGWLFTVQAMIVAQVVLTLPFLVGITMVSVASIPPELALQVRSLGATPWQTRWTMLREARAGVALALATALGRSFSEVGAVLMVGGNIERHTRVLTTAIVLETSRGRFGLALALGAVLVALALAANVAIFRLHGRPAP
jgi:tungstate transport system permease protein